MERLSPFACVLFNIQTCTHLTYSYAYSTSMNYSAGYKVEIICLLTTSITARRLLSKARSNTAVGQAGDTTGTGDIASRHKSSYIEVFINIRHLLDVH